VVFSDEIWICKTKNRLACKHCNPRAPLRSTCEGWRNQHVPMIIILRDSEIKCFPKFVRNHSKTA
jgi:hypothetical protein